MNGERDEAGVRLEWRVVVSERADRERRLGATWRALVRPLHGQVPAARPVARIAIRASHPERLRLLRE